MNRFVPDTLRDALWRPLAMALPDAGLYIEILAPDLRFAFLLALMMLGLVVAIRRREWPGFSPLWPLLAFTWLAFIPWLLTSGNGRYFIAILLLAGPLCIAFIHRLPMTAAFRAAMALLVIGVQGFAIAQVNPLGRWPLAPWSTPYFELSLGARELAEPAAYVTVTSISYSLVAPQFAPGSRWMNIASLHGDADSLEANLARAFIERALRDRLPLRVLAPTVPAYMDAEGQPTVPMRNEIDRLLVGHGMALADGEACRMAPSRTVAALAMGDLDEFKAKKVEKFGFWICDLRYPVAPPDLPLPVHEEALAAQVFGKLEEDCPRIFPRGEGIASRVKGGSVRSYPSADMKVYLLDNGDVLYKYWRALNPGRVGRAGDVLGPGFHMDCTTVRGRSGLPWEKTL